jgi:serine protease Do
MDTFSQDNQPPVREMKPVAEERDIGSKTKKKSKKGAWKTSSIVLTVVGISLVLALVIGSASLMYVFFRFVRPESQSTATVQTVQTTGRNTIAATAESTTATTAKTDATAETTNNKHFSVADAATLPDSGDKKALSTTEIASKVGPATVSVIAEVSYGSTDGQNQVAEASGSGFIVSADGYIVTNNHVIDGASTVQVVVAGEKDPITAKVVGTDATTDIAVLKIDRTNLAYVTLGDSDSLQVGELAVAIGNPFGELAGSVTVGVISALDREITINDSTYNLLQTDASINEGNSGGPLVNSYGEVVGVTNAKVSEGEGIGFAIPINDVKTVIEDLINNGFVAGRPVLGVGVVTVDQTTADQYGWPVGAYIRQVDKNSSAEKAGLQVGDIITKMDGTDITSTEDVVKIKNSHKVGDSITMTVYRNGGTLDVTIVLQEGSAT